MSGTTSGGAEERSVLLNAMADDSLTSDQERRLAELLRSDPGFRREYVLFCEMLAQLTWVSSTAAPPPPQTTHQSGDVKGSAKRAVDRQRWFQGRPGWKGLSVFAVVLSLAVIFSGSLWFGAPSPGSITQVRGRIGIVRDGQPPMSLGMEDVARATSRLRRNDTIRTDPGSSATVRLKDGTELRIGSESEVVFSDRPDAHVVLSRGTIAAAVAPQPAKRPMTFATSRALVRVLGTELELLELDQRTDVAVTEGKVRVTRTTDQATTEVASSQFVSVQESGPLSVVDWPRPPEVWSEDFEESSAGWTGRFVGNGLPPGSRGGLQAIAVAEPRGRSMVASSPTAAEGLFAWHDDTMLHVTFRVQPPAWFHIYVFARTYQRAEPLVAWCRVDPELWLSRPGEWRTVDIPLADFDPVGSEPAGTTLGRIPVRLAFVGPADLPGIVVDRIRVDRSGSPSNSNLTGRGRDEP